LDDRLQTGELRKGDDRFFNPEVGFFAGKACGKFPQADFDENLVKVLIQFHGGHRSSVNAAIDERRFPCLNARNFIK
jgi:hypothetical protein